MCGIGDDGAVLEPPAGAQIVVTTDVLLAGVHFFPDDDPASIGHKALAVNLSDLAAMGATPAWFTLGVSLPAIDADWLRAFCDGLYALARRHEMQLIGGDTVRGPLAIAITAHGFVPRAEALLRSGARVGDRIYVSGELGDAGLALRHRQGRLRLDAIEAARVLLRRTRPTPRIECGTALRGIATSAIDISDGLVADLGHILEASSVGARVRLDKLPVSAIYRAHLTSTGWDVALTNGDDYELCFTVPPANLGALATVQARLDCRLTEIGEITAAETLEIFDAAGERYTPAATSYDHFTST